jgi:hypothetical protein
MADEDSFLGLSISGSMEEALPPPSVEEPSFFEPREECMSWRTVRRIGMHWTRMVPVISDEYL